MLNDRKIKRKLNNELKPTVSADRFCSDAGISFESVEKPEQRFGRKWLPKVFLPIAAAAAVCLCIVLPLTLSGRDESPNDIIKYGENDVVYNRTTIEKIFADEQALMFNQTYVLQVGTTHLITPIEDSTILGYRISEVVFAEIIDGVPSFALMFDYLVRCYDGYTITGADIYSKTDSAFTQNGISFNYCIIGENESQEAYIYFECGKYDYYIHLCGYGQITEINDDSVRLFLQKAFTEEKQNDEAVSRRKVDS